MPNKNKNGILVQFRLDERRSNELDTAARILGLGRTELVRRFYDQMFEQFIEKNGLIKIQGEILVK